MAIINLDEIFEVDKGTLRLIAKGCDCRVKIHPIGNYDVSVAGTERLEALGLVYRVRGGADAGRLLLTPRGELAERELRLGVHCSGYTLGYFDAEGRHRKVLVRNYFVGRNDADETVYRSDVFDIRTATAVVTGPPVVSTTERAAAEALVEALNLDRPDLAMLMPI